MEARIAVHAHWLGIAYKVCVIAGGIGLVFCGWAQWENCCG